MTSLHILSTLDLVMLGAVCMAAGFSGGAVLFYAVGKWNANESLYNEGYEDCSKWHLGTLQKALDETRQEWYDRYSDPKRAWVEHGQWNLPEENDEPSTLRQKGAI